MKRIGIRELRQRASDYIRLAERGESIEITDRGRPVALLSPLPQGSALERMRASGDIEPAVGDLDDLPSPLPSRAAESPSSRLARLRDDER